MPSLFPDPGPAGVLLPGPQDLGGAYLAIEEAVEDGHHKTLGKKGAGDVRQTDSRSPQPCTTHGHGPCVPLVNQRAKHIVGG